MLFKNKACALLLCIVLTDYAFEDNPFEHEVEIIESLTEGILTKGVKRYKRLKVNALRVHDEQIDGSLIAAGTSDLPDLVVVGTTAIEGITTLTHLLVTGSIVVQGPSTLNNLVVTGTMTVQGASTLNNLLVTGSMVVQGNSSLNDLSVIGTLTVEGPTTLNNLLVTGSMAVQGNSSLNDLSVIGTMTVQGPSTLNNLLITGSMVVQGTSQLNSNLVITGNFTGQVDTLVNNVYTPSVEQDNSFLTAPVITSNLTVEQGALLNNLTVLGMFTGDGNFTCGGSETLNGNLTVLGTTTLQNSSVTENILANSSAYITDNSTAGSYVDTSYTVGTPGVPGVGGVLACGMMLYISSSDYTIGSGDLFPFNFATNMYGISSDSSNNFIIQQSGLYIYFINLSCAFLDSLPEFQLYLTNSSTAVPLSSFSFSPSQTASQYAYITAVGCATLASGDYVAIQNTAAGNIYLGSNSGNSSTVAAFTLMRIAV